MAARNNATKLSLGTTILMAVTGAFLLGSVALGAKVLFPGGEGYRQAALDNAQRVEFSLVTGEIEGKLLLLDEVLPKKPENEVPDTEETPASAPEDATPDVESTETAGSDPVVDDQPTATEAPLPNEAVTETPAAEAPAPMAEAASTAPAVEAPAKTTEPAAEPTAPAAAPVAPEPALPPIDPVQKRLDNGTIVPIAAEGVLPMQFYAQKPQRPVAGNATLSIALTGLGMAKRPTEAAIALPSAITLSFSPYGKLTREWAAAAREKGHELLLDLPLETIRAPGEDPGPDGILVKQSKQEMTARFLRTLGKASGYIGLVLPYDDSLSDTPRILELLELFHTHGVLMVNSHPQPPSAMFQASERTGTAILHATILLDSSPGETHIRNQLARAEDLSRRYGRILVLGKAQPLTISLLDQWLKTLPQKNITVVPVSAAAPLPPEKLVSPYAAEFNPAAAAPASRNPASVPADATTPAGVTLPND